MECKPREKVWVRWREVPCSVSAEYLSHTGFRLFHAGPGGVMWTRCGCGGGVFDVGPPGFVVNFNMFERCAYA